MKSLLLFLALAACFGPLSPSAWAQNDTASKPFRFDFHGFVNPHYYADSRSVVGGREDMMLFYPKPVALDANGNDLNDGWQANMMSITTRLNLLIHGPRLLGANTLAFIEGDFTGSTNASNNDLRLRHAYISLDWGRGGSLLAGQYWYAMVIPEIMPMTNPLNMGAPFHPYARYNQVRYRLPLGPVEFAATAMWQLDNASQGLLNGTATTSTQFARNCMIPELNARLMYVSPYLMLGGAVNLKTIQPVVPDPEGQLHTSPSYTVFGRLRLTERCNNDSEILVIKAQALLNNSLYEGCSLGGYLMLTDGSFEDWHFNTFWVDLSCPWNWTHWHPGVFFGYAKNKDYGLHSDALHIFGRGHDIEYLWRIQPRLTYTTGKALSFTAEAEYTRAGYITPTNNLRLSLTMQYDF